MSDRKEDRSPFIAALTPPGTDAGSPPPSGADHGETFVPGTVFAGRYRMVTRVGSGGMGEVWRADDLVLETPVAIKLVYSTSRDARARLLREVRLARQITHPAVCRVFDVGEADGQVFYSMEFVEGEDLATLLRRAGRLTQERALDIGRQLCAGLAAAHAQGVLHRDLKPANVLVDENGAIRVTDFGIAIARSDGEDRTLIGTPGYMAPEQYTLGARLTERTDIYAIGLILYEMLVGQRPFADPQAQLAPPRRPSAIVADLDPRVDRILLKALAPKAADRPASVSAIAEALPETAAPSTRPHRARSWIAAGALAAVVVVLAVLSSRFWAKPAVALTDQDTIVLADFVNTTGEPVFDGTLKVALAVALEQSPFLKVFPDDAMRDTLQLMERPTGAPVTKNLARDIALREQLKAVVSGSIGPIGSHYVIALEAMNAETGDVMAREQVEASSKEQVLTVLGQATATLRERLGESLPSIQKFDAPLARATTSSLEALHAYSLALDDGRVLLQVSAIPHLKRAIELDPNFALAYALLSGVYTNVGQSEEAPPYAKRAYELRDRVSERERYFISWRYYLDALQAWDKALELASSWTQSYPREAFAFNSLGLAAAAFGQHERAVDAFREAIRLDPKFVPPHRNLAGSLIALDRFDDARSQIEEATRNGIGSIGLRQMQYVIGFVTGRPASPFTTGAVAGGGTSGDAAAGAGTGASAETAEERMWTVNSEARAAAAAGRFDAAHTLFQQGVQMALRAHFTELAAHWTIEDAEAHALGGHCVDARREVAAGLALARDNYSLERAGRTLAVCGAADEAARISNELAARYPEATLTMRVQRPVIAAAAALERGDAARARDLLEPVTPYDHAPAAEFWPAYLRGQAYLRLEDGAAAAAQFAGIVAHRGEAPTSPLFALAQLGSARAAVLAGDPQAPAKYDAFLKTWAGADLVAAVTDARRESAGLQ